MARPPTDGKSYFPLDVAFMEDDSVKLLKAEFGATSVLIWVLAMCQIYRDKGYYKNWDKDTCLLMSDGIGGVCTPNFVQEVINGCARRGLFDKSIYNAFGILTSHGIQKRYLRMCSDDEEVTIIKEFFLLDAGNKKDVPPSMINKLVFKSLKGTEKDINLTEKDVNLTENSQRKKEENKENKKLEVSKYGEKRGRESYEEILNTFEVSKEMRPIVWQFIKHCQMAGKPLINDKLIDILFRLDRAYLRDDREKIVSLKRAINGGHYDIAEGKN